MTVSKKDLTSVLLQYAKQFEVACILVSNSFEDRFGNYELLAGFGEKEHANEPSALNEEQLQLGFLSYDLKNKIENLSSKNASLVNIPDFYFFVPNEVLKLQRNGETISTLNADLNALQTLGDEFKIPENIEWKCKTDRQQYYSNIESIKKQIEEGDFYEINYCIEWEASNPQGFDPYATFFLLNQRSPAPFAAFFKFGNKFLLCSSPERFLQKKGQHLVSQPIKGTRPRVHDKTEDERTISELMHSEKDRSENIMITDLVRNDLSRVCSNGTVKVDELCGIYSFSHVHQMISTISGEILEEKQFEDIVKATFPMGSMTGAPKIKVMMETEKYENFKRGWYSGCVGWYEKGNFDLNVVIRSLQYDADKPVLAYHVGGAIVYDSIAESEYEECMVKAAGILSVFKK